MVTIEDLGRAAALFEDAAAMAHTLAVSAEGIDAAAILHGGLLARQVPERIADAAVTARQCHDEIEVAAQTCRDRAIELAVYHQDLAAYDVAFANYFVEKESWDRRFMSWVMDRSFTVQHPGYQPVAPRAPVAPTWLE